MATIKAVLNKDRARENGSYSLVIQIIHKRVKRVIYTPYKLKVTEFNVIQQKSQYATEGNYTRKQIKEINHFIENKKIEFEKIVNQMISYGHDFTVEDVMTKYHLDQDNKCLITFMEHYIAKKEAQGKMGTARTLRSTLRSLKKYMGSQTIKFADIDSHFVRGYEDFLHDRNVKQNTICFYLRNFQSIYNRAYDSGMEMSSQDAFRKISIKTIKTVKRALKQEQIKELSLLDFSGNHELEKARDLFMFSFYTRGMSFIDIIFLKHADIVNGVIRYHRKKTGQYIEVAVTKPLRKLINKYNTDKVYVLPFINESSHPTLYTRYQSIYGVIYSSLNKIKKILELPTPLTTYVARHSWATIAKEKGVSTTIISEGLGHTSEKTTRIYLKEFDHSVIDSANECIVSFLR